MPDPRAEFGTLQSLQDGADAGPSSETTRSSGSSTDVSNGKIVNDNVNNFIQIYHNDFTHKQQELTEILPQILLVKKRQNTPT